MKYALLIYHNEAETRDIAPAEAEARVAAYWAYTTEIQEAGVFTGVGEALHPVATATTVRVRDGQTLTSDGPFAETKEQLGGLYVVDCEDLDQAIKYAAKIPDAKNGSIEIRPIIDFD